MPPPRILVADDDTELLDLVGDALREDGYEVVEEANGGRLLVRVAAIYARGRTVDPIDLIISDVCMPVCSGLDILLGLRNAHWSTPVILMTAYGDPDVRARALHLGAVLLEKPFAASVLREKVKTLLHGATAIG
jgi:DNA-binding response OmpR family regulator